MSTNYLFQKWATNYLVEKPEQENKIANLFFHHYYYAMDNGEKPLGPIAFVDSLQLYKKQNPDLTFHFGNYKEKSLLETLIISVTINDVLTDSDEEE